MSIIESCLRRHLHAFLILFHIVALNTAVSAFKHAHLSLFFKSTGWTILITQQLLLLQGCPLHVLAVSLKCAVKIISGFILFSELPDHVQIFQVTIRGHLQILILHVLSLLSDDASVIGVLLLGLFPFSSLDLQPL